MSPTELAFQGRGYFVEGNTHCATVRLIEDQSIPEEVDVEKIDKMLEWADSGHQIEMPWPISSGIQRFGEWMFNLDLLPDLDEPSVTVSFAHGEASDEHGIMVCHFDWGWVFLSSRDDAGSGFDLLGSLA